MNTLKQLMRATLMVIALIVIGTLGFYYIEHLSVIDSLYTTIITITTLGIELVKPLSTPGKIFTMLLSLSSVFIIFAVVFTAIINALEIATSENLQHLLWRRKMEKSLRNMKDHYVICGFGRMGQAIAAEFRATNIPFVVIENNPEQLPRLVALKIIFVEGDASDEQTLIDAGVARAKCLISVAPSDADNTFIVLTAKGINPNLFVVARSIVTQDEPKLRRAGADRVMSPYVLGGKRMAWAALHPNVADSVQDTICNENLEFEISEVKVTGKSEFVRKKLGESRIKEDSGATVIGIRGIDDGLTLGPDPDTEIRPGDTIVAVGNAHQLDRLRIMAHAQK